MDKSSIKRAGELIEYTPANLIELKRCSEDPIYFIENYVKIEHPMDGLIDFKLYPYQKHMLRSFLDNRFTLCEVSRQTGKCVLNTTFITIYYTPISIKKLILKLFFRKTYNEIFQK